MNKPLVESIKKNKGHFDVLIVDADPDSLERLKTLCEGLGYFRFIVTAKDGREASAKLSKQKFRLILMDLTLPKKNGIELIKVIENSENCLSRVFIVSSSIAQEDFKVLMSKGLKQIMVKPFENDVLKSRLEKLLGLS